MRVRTSICAAAIVAATAVVVVVPATPAGAAISTSTAGTTLNVTVTGDQVLRFSCTAGSVAFDVGAPPPSPSLPCSTVTQITVTGDIDDQSVFGDDLNTPEFSANPRLSATLGSGNDSVTESDQADTVALGPGTDTLSLAAVGAANTSLDLGANGDFLILKGTAGNDAINASSTTSTLSASMQTTSGTRTHTVTNAEIVYVRPAAGNDAVNTSGITDASTIASEQIDGDDGNDTLLTGTIPTVFIGGKGTNSMTGGNDNDRFETTSETDTIVTGGGFDTVIDVSSLRTGGRTIGAASPMSWTHQFEPGDMVTRVRDAAVGSTVTVSLTQPGQQALPQNAVSINFYRRIGGAPFARGLYDLHALDGNRDINVSGDTQKDDLLDVTIPSGSWTVTGNLSSEGSITTADAALGNISVADMGAVSVHGPWTNKNRGWTHRIYRDLLFRFADNTTLDEGEALLGNGTVTRPEVTASLMNTDEYRGIDVDRVYVKFLRRAADPGGRSSWITALRNGKSLLKFRGQLIGSSEYFTKAGGTNADFVDRAYADVLGRAPDPSGKAYWTNKLNNGADRGAVAISFMNNTEPRRTLVADQFLRFLDRMPTSGEYATWEPTLKNAPTGEQQLIAFLANSAAYYNRS